MSGDYDAARRDFYFDMANYLANSPNNNYTIYKLSSKVALGKQETEENGVILVGLPKLEDHVKYEID